MDRRDAAKSWKAASALLPDAPLGDPITFTLSLGAGITEPYSALAEITSGWATQPEHPTSPNTPRGLARVATDGESACGRLAWVPGA